MVETRLAYLAEKVAETPVTPYRGFGTDVDLSKGHPSALPQSYPGPIRPSGTDVDLSSPTASLVRRTKAFPSLSSMETLTPAIETPSFPTRVGGAASHLGAGVIGGVAGDWASHPLETSLSSRAKTYGGPGSDPSTRDIMSAYGTGPVAASGMASLAQAPRVVGGTIGGMLGGAFGPAGTAAGTTLGTAVGRAVQGGTAAAGATLGDLYSRYAPGWAGGAGQRAVGPTPEVAGRGRSQPVSTPQFVAQPQSPMKTSGLVYNMALAAMTKVAITGS